MIDVAIVGGGYTGLWTAYHLLSQRPELRVEVFEAEHVGFGASGRNGGWVSALWPVSLASIAAQHSEAAAMTMAAALRETVDLVGAVCAQEGIDAGFVKGGALLLARGPAQVVRARSAVESGARWGEQAVYLDRDEARARLAIADADGASWHPDCARIHPGRLVRGLAQVVRRLGGVIHEGARVTALAPGELTVAGERQQARSVITATEAWTSQLPGRRRRVVPVYSLMVATEPLSPQMWEQLGLAGREVFSDHGHLVTYGQRTVDDRIAFGGRGAPYHFGSGIRPRFDVVPSVHRRLRETLTSWLPQLAGVQFTHAWGGPLGIARDWHPSVTYDPVTRLGAAGGYVGDGVAATHLAGRTLAELVLIDFGLSRPSVLSELPWVGHVGPSWEPEPLRWLGVNAGLQVARLADLEERITRRPALSGRLLDALTGG